MPGGLSQAVETNVLLVKASEVLPPPPRGSLTFSRNNPRGTLAEMTGAIDALVVEPMRCGLGELVEDICRARPPVILE